VDGRAIGDFRKRWRKACKAIGLSDRIVHDLRRSGVRHLVRAGVPLHTVMAFSGHRTPSMLKRYDIIALDDLRAVAEKGSAFAGAPGEVVPMRTRRVAHFGRAWLSWKRANCSNRKVEPRGVEPPTSLECDSIRGV
jgi:hypothetical protein